MTKMVLVSCVITSAILLVSCGDRNVEKRGGFGEIILSDAELKLNAKKSPLKIPTDIKNLPAPDTLR